MVSQVTDTFEYDVLKGLRQSPKTLPSKYFYDTQGDKLFQQIMKAPEYYLTDCEMDIFRNKTDELATLIDHVTEPFDVVELGAGDCSKTIYLLKKMAANGTPFTYYPIDISKNIIDFLETTLPIEIPGHIVYGLNGDYFDMLQETARLSKQRKVVLCLGANIGNMTREEAEGFCEKLYENLAPGDLLLMGFDLIKNPRLILSAYNDAAGITSEFNLNLLRRINRELGADFPIGSFEHYCSYEPQTGACKSFLISLEDVDVTMDAEIISFKKDEYIWMEISQKYSIEQISELAYKTGFMPLGEITDSRNWFADCVWIRI
ncbi:MAG: L-histidine N(alpha)-methyltransferase [Mucilaginibacter sp.]